VGHFHPERATSISLQRHIVDDVSAFNSLSPSRHRDYVQIGKGPFKGEVTKVEVGPASVQTNILEREILGCVRSATPTVFIAAPLPGCSPSRFNGHRITERDFIIHWGEEDKVWQTGEYFRCGVIELPAQTAPGHMPFADPSVHARAGGALMMRDSEMREGLRSLATAAHAMAEMRHRTVSVEGFVSSFIAHCWAVVERCCRKDIDRAVMLPMSKRARIVKTARDLIHRDEETPLNVAQLASAMAMPERTLSECFRASIGRSPRTYLRIHRLNRARAYILCHAEEEANVVTAAAMKYGFWHLGRFSAYYRDLFGEYPSETACAVSGYDPDLTERPAGEGNPALTAAG